MIGNSGRLDCEMRERERSRGAEMEVEINIGEKKREERKGAFIDPKAMSHLLYFSQSFSAISRFLNSL